MKRRACSSKDDPYDYDDQVPEDSYQAWVGQNIPNSNLRYKEVVKTTPRHYPSPKEKGRVGGFLASMKKIVMNTRPVEPVVIRGRKKIIKNNIRSSDPFNKLSCSSDIKRFIEKEFRREKVLNPCLPEEQVKLAVIHRYKTMLCNNNVENINTEQIRTLRSHNSPVDVTNSGDNKNSQITSLRDFSEEDFHNKNKKEKFKEVNAVNPIEGSLSMSPSPSQLKINNLVLLRFNHDSDAPEITEINSLSQTADIKYSPMQHKVKLATTLLPNLLSSSPTSEDTDFYWDEDKFCPSEVSILSVIQGVSCGWCLKTDRLQLCSVCQTIGYCSPVCQKHSWPYHKKVCKRLLSAEGQKKVELVSLMRTIQDNDEVAPGRKVQFLLPDSEPGRLLKRKVAPCPTPKPILKKISVQQVPFSPPVLELGEHIKVHSYGDQEERFEKLSVAKVETPHTSLSSCKLKMKVSDVRKNLVSQFCDDEFEEERTGNIQIIKPPQDSPRPSIGPDTPPNSREVKTRVMSESYNRNHRNKMSSRMLDDTSDEMVVLFPKVLKFDQLDNEEMNPTSKEGSNIMSSCQSTNNPLSPDMFSSQSSENNEVVNGGDINEMVDIGNDNDGDGGVKNVVEYGGSQNENVVDGGAKTKNMLEDSGTGNNVGDCRAENEDYIDDSDSESLGIFSPMNELDQGEDSNFLGISGGRVFPNKDHLNELLPIESSCEKDELADMFGNSEDELADDVEDDFLNNIV